MEERKREKVQATLAHAFYEFHKLKSLDHQTAQLEIKIKKKKNQAIAFCKYSCLADTNKKIYRLLGCTIFPLEKKKLVILRNILEKGMVADLSVSCQRDHISQWSWR